MKLIALSIVFVFVAMSGCAARQSTVAPSPVPNMTPPDLDKAKPQRCLIAIDSGNTLTIVCCSDIMAALDRCMLSEEGCPEVLVKEAANCVLGPTP